MKKSIISVGTWTPLFSGFYETIWNADCESDYQIEYINEIRAEKGLPKIGYNEFEFDFEQWNQDCAQGFVKQIERELKGFVSSIKYTAVKSPKYYNYSTDSIEIDVEFSQTNIKNIATYLKEHAAAFEAMLQEKYTSRSGFISHYPNTTAEYMSGGLKEVLAHSHKAGMILEFICVNEDVSEYSIYSDITGNFGLEVTNYDELTRDNYFLQVLDVDKCKQLIAATNKEEITILCPNYSINIQSKYENGEQCQADWDAFEKLIGDEFMYVNDFDDLCVDAQGVMSND